MESGALSGYDEEMEMAAAIADSDERIAAAYYCHNDEALTYYSSAGGPYIPDEGTVYTDRSWYIGALAGGVFLSEPYVDEVSGEFCITISKAVEIDGEVTGVVGVDFLIGQITDLVLSSDVGSGYLMMASAEGVILVHPNEEPALSPDHSVSLEEAASGCYGSLKKSPDARHLIFDYTGGPKAAIAEQSEVSGWILAAGNLDIHFQDMNGITEIDVLNASINNTVDQLQYYIQDITRIVERIAEYDLSVVSDAEYKGDFTVIQNGLNSIIEQLNNIFSQIDIRADAVFSYSKQIQEASDIVVSGATGKSFAVVAEEINSLSSASTDASKKTSELLKATKKAVELGRKLTMDTAKELTEGIQSAKISKESVVQMKKSLRVQQEQVAAIGALTDEMAGVVETNAASAQENAASVQS